MAEVEASNLENIKLKEKRREEEKRLEQEIVEYQRQKDLVIQAQIKEAQRLAAEKEKETQRLREL